MAEAIFFIFSATISVVLFVASIARLFQDEHPIFSIFSLFSFMLASLICTYLAYIRSITAQIAALFINVYFLHRIPLLYVIPDWMDYSVYLGGSQYLIEEASVLFLFIVLFLALGISGFRFVCFSGANGAPLTRMIGGGIYLRCVIFKASWMQVLRLSIPIAASLLAVKIYAMVTFNLGITGAVRTDASLNTLLALTETVNYFLPIAMFCFALGLSTDYADLKKKAVILLALCLLWLILVASRAALLSFIIYFYVAMRFVGLEDQKKYLKILSTLGLLAIFAYPFLTYSRYLFLGEDVPFIEWITSFNLIKAISARLGTAVESYFLWFKYISLGAQEQLPTVLTLLIDGINSLVPGSIFSEPQLTNVAKLQVSIGRPEVPFYSSAEYLSQLGGHGENTGQYGMSFILFGYFAPLTFFVTGFLASMMERARVDIFWKYYWIPSLLTTPWIIPASATMKTIVIIVGLVIFLHVKRIVIAGGVNSSKRTAAMT